MANVMYSVYLPLNIAVKIESLVEEKGVSKSSILRDIIIEHFEGPQEEEEVVEPQEQVQPPHLLELLLRKLHVDEWRRVLPMVYDQGMRKVCADYRDMNLPKALAIFDIDEEGNTLKIVGDGNFKGKDFGEFEFVPDFEENASEQWVNKVDWPTDVVPW